MSSLSKCPGQKIREPSRQELIQALGMKQKMAFPAKETHAAWQRLKKKVKAE